MALRNRHLHPITLLELRDFLQFLLDKIDARSNGASTIDSSQNTFVAELSNLKEMVANSPNISGELKKQCAGIFL